MAIQTLTLSVLIASPGDTAPDRDVVEDAIRSWNSDHTMRRKIHLLPLRWELGVLTRRVVDAADWGLASECGVAAVVVVGVE
ncbi:hypothetical protein AB0C94_14670, partial [Streptomyces griseus]